MKLYIYLDTKGTIKVSDPEPDGEDFKLRSQSFRMRGAPVIGADIGREHIAMEAMKRFPGARV